MIPALKRRAKFIPPLRVEEAQSDVPSVDFAGKNFADVIEFAELDSSWRDKRQTRTSLTRRPVQRTATDHVNVKMKN